MDISLLSFKHLSSQPILQIADSLGNNSLSLLTCCILLTAEFQIPAKGTCGEVLRCSQMV